MRRHILSFAAGFSLASVFFLFVVLPKERREKYEYGHYHGTISARMEILDKLPAVLGDDYRKEDGYNTFMEVKDGAIVVVERNGVKTLRVYEPKQ